MSFSKSIPFLLTLCAAALFSQPTSVFAADALTDASSAAKAPEWKVEDLNGKSLSAADLRGKVVVLDFWATWCGPCRAEIPGYVQLQKKYQDRGLVIVGLSVDQAGPGVVKKFVSAQKVDYRVAMANDDLVSAFGPIEAIPTTFIIDQEGRIRFKKVGSMETEEFEKLLLPLLK
jgi:thiol-disulfide isomerase/thioredoxin